MQFTRTAIADVVVIDPVIHEDARGFLMETWQERRYRDAGIDARFVQDVHSRSSRNTLRGLHYQIGRPQGKLIRVVRGEVYDVAVDVRRSSSTYGLWVGEYLSAENRRLIWIPPGFAHGFLVLSDTADFEYRMTDYYAPGEERTILWDDPDIGIDWPLPKGFEPLLSAKDLAGVAFREAETYA
jgi:dTDP-4-dehydrorhamnose 3,5-epimerase